MSKTFFISSNFNKPKLIIKNYEQGFNVLINKDNIPEPDTSNTANDIYFKNKNQNIIQKIQNKRILTEKDISIINNTGRGNCFYKAISQFYCHNEDYHLYYRKRIAEYIDSIYNIESNIYPEMYINENKIV